MKKNMLSRSAAKKMVYDEIKKYEYNGMDFKHCEHISTAQLSKFMGYCDQYIICMLNEKKRPVVSEWVVQNIIEAIPKYAEMNGYRKVIK